MTERAGFRADSSRRRPTIHRLIRPARYPAPNPQELIQGGWTVADEEDMNAVLAQVQELEGQVTAFTDFGEAIKAVDGVLGQVSEELAGAETPPPRTIWTGRREVRAVALA
jgi:hypothetical protein